MAAMENSQLIEELLPVYYKRLFPFEQYFLWLSYGRGAIIVSLSQLNEALWRNNEQSFHKTYFSNREFSFTIKDDVYLRYQSFSNKEELVREIQSICPFKIDIGAVYNFRPKDHKTVRVFKPKEKELVFDIDMTDYDDVRNCCSGADICPKCWPLMTIAIRIIDRAMRDDFGFQHLLWVYSGRRGIHCWVCDDKARELTQDARSSIAEYLSVVKGGGGVLKKTNLHDIHPSVEKALGIITEEFENLHVKAQNFLSNSESIKKILGFIQDEKMSKQLYEDLLSCKDSTDRWTLLEDHLKRAKEQMKPNRKQFTLEEILLQYCYPRLDINVTKGINHLLKSPFCVHPKTGRICVPIDISNLDSFDPFEVPTISQLINELDASSKSSDLAGNDQAKKVKDYKKTSLYKSILTFEKFLNNLEHTWKGKLLQQSDLQQKF